MSIALGLINTPSGAPLTKSLSHPGWSTPVVRNAVRIIEQAKVMPFSTPAVVGAVMLAASGLAVGGFVLGRRTAPPAQRNASMPVRQEVASGEVRD